MVLHDGPLHRLWDTVLACNVSANLDELAQHRAVSNNASVRLNVRRAGSFLYELAKITKATRLIQVPLPLQVFAHRDGVRRLIAVSQLTYRNEDQFMVSSIEVIGPDHKPLEGLKLEDADPLTKTGRHRVSWGGKSDLSKLDGTPIQLKISIQNAKLYSFQFE